MLPRHASTARGSRLVAANAKPFIFAMLTASIGSIYWRSLQSTQLAMPRLLPDGQPLSCRFRDHGRLNAGVRHLNVVYAQPHPRPGWSRLSGRIQGNPRAARSVPAGIGSLRGAQARVYGHLRLARGLALAQRPNPGGLGCRPDVHAADQRRGQGGAR